MLTFRPSTVTPLLSTSDTHVPLIERACARCQRRKVKCERKEPTEKSCSQCSLRNFACQIPERKTKVACGSCRSAKVRCEPVGNFCEQSCSRCYKLNRRCTRSHPRAHLNSGCASAVRSGAKDAYRLYEQPPGPTSPPIESTKYQRVTLDARVKYMTVAAVANTASKTIFSIAHSKSVLSHVATLTEIYQSVFQMISCRESRRILIEWGGIMGKEKGFKYGERPNWWPTGVDFQDTQKLSSHDVKTVLAFVFCGSHGSSVPLWELYDALKRINLKKRDQQFLKWIIFIRKICHLREFQAFGKFELKLPKEYQVPDYPSFAIEPNI